jgi:hypothetical protein
MKQLRVCLAAALVLTGLVLTSILHSQTRRLTSQEQAAIGACASKYYLCNGHCQDSPAGEARANCEAECLRAYNACFNASVPPLPPTVVRVAPSPSAVAPATPTPMPRNISPQRGTGVTTTTKAQSTIAPQGAPHGGVSQPMVAAPTPTPPPRPIDYSRRPIGGAYRTNPTPTISPQGVPRDTASTASPPSPTPTMSLHRSTSSRKSHRRHRSKEASPAPAPTSQPTPER